MKEKILAFLKTLPKLKGVQDSYLLGVADLYSKTVTEETQIATTFTDGVVDLLKLSAGELQKEGDKRATEAVKTFREKHKIGEDGKPVTEPKEPKDPKDPQADPNDIRKIVADAIAAAVQPLQQKIQAQEKEKATAQLTDKVRKHEKLKDVPASFLKGRNLVPESEDKIEQLVTELANDWNTFTQEQAEKGVHVYTPMQSDGGPKGGEALGKSAAAARNKADSAAKDNPLINNKQQ